MLSDPQLKSKVDALWDRFWSGGIANPITAIESRVVPKNGTPRGLRAFLITEQLCAQQMSYLIFLKRLEEHRPPVVPLPQQSMRDLRLLQGDKRCAMRST